MDKPYCPHPPSPYANNVNNQDGVQVFTCTLWALRSWLDDWSHSTVQAWLNAGLRKQRDRTYRQWNISSNVLTLRDLYSAPCPVRCLCQFCVGFFRSEWLLSISAFESGKTNQNKTKKRSCRHNQVLNYSTLKAYFSFNVPFLQKSLVAIW